MNGNLQERELLFPLPIAQYRVHIAVRENAVHASQTHEEASCQLHVRGAFTQEELLNVVKRAPLPLYILVLLSVPLSALLSPFYLEPEECT